MKFGHDLAKVVSISDPEWAPFFIQYKLLKKYINVINCSTSIDVPVKSGNKLYGKTTPSDGFENVAVSRIISMDTHHQSSHFQARSSIRPSQLSVSLGQSTSMQAQLENIARSKPEVAFFRALRAELHKSSRFFKAAEQILEIRRERIAEALRQLQVAAERAPGTKSTLLDDAGDKALAACVTYYRDLLLLENYAIINYCGFSKILKKHDKRTGYETRARFMRVCVAPQPFTHYPRLLEMIKEAEELYHALSKAASKSANPEQSEVIQDSHPLSRWESIGGRTAGNEESMLPECVSRASSISWTVDSSARTSQDTSGKSSTSISFAHVDENVPKQTFTHVRPACSCSRKCPRSEAVFLDVASPRTRSTTKATTTSLSTSLSSFACMRREESDFIDAILNLRSEAARLRAAEDAPASPRVPTAAGSDFVLQNDNFGLQCQPYKRQRT
mmetsp:Transcript_4070/g.16386  ORF Transcript_4070/g.16386 Transcript_4070/m.16386 type:complete len:446 (-) Transcript_4070:378-1715(-)